MDDIQSWWEVPCIAHFCSLFRAAFNLLDFDIEELEEALLTDGAEDSGSSLLQELIVRLLCGCLGNNDISTFNYQMFLRRLFRQKCQEYGRENPFNTDMDFQFLPLRTKVEILHALCDFRLDADDVQDVLKNLESDSLRVEPLGHDENHSAYWYFYGTRLYREDYPKAKKRVKEKKRRLKDEKRKKKRGKSPADSEGEEQSSSVWQVVCFTEEDWDKVTEGFRDSTSKVERALYHTLSEDFLPEIPRLFSEKEKLQRKRLLEYQPRRQSSRLEKLKQQKEEEERLQQKEGERQRQERERKERLLQGITAKEERANRALMRSISRTNSECGSTSSLTDLVPEPRGFIGRQTNNSLSSATGQIVIQGLRRKLRGSQVFRQSEEDLQTGMYKILEHVKAHEDAWPFLDAVDEKYAPRYYSIIARPMDLQKMEEKLDDGEYLSFAEFKADFQLIVDNCRQYNGTDNEYTEMVGNLQEAFQMAAERYLESDPSSDEDASVELPKRQSHSSTSGHGNVQGSKKKGKTDKNQELEDKMESDERSLTPSSILSEASGESEKEPEVCSNRFENTESVHEDGSESASLKNESESENQYPRSTNGNKRNKKTGVIKNAAAIEALELATEQTLKDINKWLDDTPRFSEFSSASNSPSYFMNTGTEEYDGSTRVDEHKNSSKSHEKAFRKEQKDASKKRLNKDPAKQQRKREVQRTIDRLQPGKSKGNLLSNIQSTSKVAEDGSIAGKPKDGKALQPVKSEETMPKLSLGSVLRNDVLAFGVGSGHNFSTKEEAEDTKFDLSEDELSKVPVDVKVPVSPESHKPVCSNLSAKKETEESVESTKNIVQQTKQEKATPNLSAWFKAFGAPRTLTVQKKKSDSCSQENESLPTGERTDSQNVPFTDKSHTFERESVPSKYSSIAMGDLYSGRMPEESEKRSLHSPQQRSGQEEATTSPLQNVSRQRRISTGSSMSERSSFSQDPMDPLDGSSPRVENYSTHYPSPLHRSPVAASPLMASPRPEDNLKLPPYQPINGTIRAGFYQDTSSLQKGSPDKNSSNGSPRDQMHSSAFPLYSPRMYPPANDSIGYSTYQGRSPESPAALLGPKSLYSSVPVYSASPMMQYYDTSKPLTDQYRAARTQAAEEDVPSSVNTSNVTTFSTSHQQSTGTSTSASSTMTKSLMKPSSIFPVKKRLYSEVEPSSVGRLPPPAHASDRAPLEGFVADQARDSVPLDCARHSPERAHQMSLPNIVSGNERFHSNVENLHAPMPVNEKSLALVTNSDVISESPRLKEEFLNQPNVMTGRASPQVPRPLSSPCSKNTLSDDDVQVIGVLKKSHASSPNLLLSSASSLSPKQSHLAANSKSLTDCVPNVSNKTFMTNHLEHDGPLKENAMSKKNAEAPESCIVLHSHKDVNVTVPHKQMRQVSPPMPQPSPSSLSVAPPAHSGDFSFHRAPFSPLPQSPVGVDASAPLRGSITNLSHIVERFPTDGRGISAIQGTSSQYYIEKTVKNQLMFSQNISSSIHVPSTSATNVPVFSQVPSTIATLPYNRNSPTAPSLNYTQSQLSPPLKTTNNQGTYSRSEESSLLSVKNSVATSGQTTFTHSVSDLSSALAKSSSTSPNIQASLNKPVADLSPVLTSKDSQPIDLQVPFAHQATDLTPAIHSKISGASANTTSHNRQMTDYLPSNKASPSTEMQGQPKSRKRKTKVAVASSGVSVASSVSGSTAFQQYVGLKGDSVISEPTAISLKTTSVVPGSAFNFGPRPGCLGIYSDKDTFAGYLEDYRTASTNYYIAASESGRDKMVQNSPAPSANPFQVFTHSQPRQPAYSPLAQAFINHQQALVDPPGAPGSIYQPYELLRHSSSPMVLHQGLLPPPSGFPPGYHPALSIRQPYDSVNRPSWL
ncbi:mucin-12 [Schistocerca cancellata]|uniref:mucin-12 n=1 Tax=Schistocerca cancellata TaxID=274614 RepID=UPI00211959F3|nr:mucin-12 [Schistocerca cancellata]